VGARSAGILLYRRVGRRLEVLIAHPGGPLWAKRQAGAWSIPKGLVEPGESELETARREFAEETGTDLGAATATDLGRVQLRSGKTVTVWAVAGDLDPATTRSNSVRMEWPPRSGRMIEFPEIDEVRWCSPDEASRLLNPAQVEFIGRLQERLDHTE
jgi:predicted NUDIX family NTP pyrophosphohydrolase